MTGLTRIKYDAWLDNFGKYIYSDEYRPPDLLGRFAVEYELSNFSERSEIYDFICDNYVNERGIHG